MLTNGGTIAIGYELLTFSNMNSSEKSHIHLSKPFIIIVTAYMLVAELSCLVWPVTSI